jgi:hypothetical protein
VTGMDGIYLQRKDGSLQEIEKAGWEHRFRR